jgi:hypothetical protein
VTQNAHPRPNHKIVYKTSTREKKLAMAGAGKRGDMDDEIPF